MSVNNVRRIESMVLNFDEFTANQVPFAVAQALTVTTKIAQVAVTDHDQHRI
ncbi:hypothetical protein [Undibacterium sp. Ren11W]|uniref:hypothetical protein n=1 Tax=Undibacterium sp. Ren11W TaxID=3413045 RepID=UPI003BF43ED7